MNSNKCMCVNIYMLIRLSLDYAFSFLFLQYVPLYNIYPSAEAKTNYIDTTNSAGAGKKTYTVFSRLGGL